MGEWLTREFMVICVLIGAAVIFAAATASVMIVGLLIAIHFPRLHFGKPKNILELRTTDRRRFTENGEPRPPTILQQIPLTWWLGLGSRNRATWWVGFIRFGETLEESPAPPPSAAP